MNKRIRRIVLAVAAMMILTVSCTLFASQLRCRFVAWSTLRQVNGSLYVDPAMTAGDVDRIGILLSDARARDAGFYGSLRSAPQVIAGTDERVIEDFGGHGNRTAATHFVLGETYVVLGPDGMNVDVMAHELMHAELRARLGWWVRDVRIPAWFDEGLAMQADDWEDYREEAWQRETRGGALAPPLEDLTGESAFTSEGYWRAFATSKHEVRRWLDIVGTAGLADFLKLMERGDAFADAYGAVGREGGRGVRK